MPFHGIWFFHGLFWPKDLRPPEMRSNKCPGMAFLPDSHGFPASNLASNAKEMGKIKLFPTTEYGSKQASDPVVPLVPYRGVFKRIYIFSPSVNIDDGWMPVKKHIEKDLGVTTEREQTYWDEWDKAALGASSSSRRRPRTWK